MTFVPVTAREGVTGRGNGGDPARGGPTRGRGARAHEAIVDTLSSVTQRAQDVRARRRAGMTDEEAAAPDVQAGSLWRDGPASPADQWAYLRSGAWAPGDQSPLLERLGKAYGLIAFLITVAVVVPVWVVQRPSRFGIVAVVALLLWGSTFVGGPS